MYVIEYEYRLMRMHPIAKRNIFQSAKSWPFLFIRNRVQDVFCVLQLRHYCGIFQIFVDSKSCHISQGH